jgi:hypothetical protein
MTDKLEIKLEKTKHFIAAVSITVNGVWLGTFCPGHEITVRTPQTTLDISIKENPGKP